MSKLIETEHSANTYLGMVKVELDSRCWPSECAPNKGLIRTTHAGFRKYADMCAWLKVCTQNYKFDWYNTGNYLPSGIYLDPESAVAFRLKFCMNYN